MGIIATFTTLIALGILIVYWLAFWTSSCDTEQKIANTFCSIILVSIFWFFMTTIICFTGRDSGAVDITESSQTVEIVSLRPDSSIDGSFFIGCGYINSTRSYIYYEKLEGKENAFRENNLPTKSCILVEGLKEGESPRIEYELQNKVPNKWVRFPLLGSFTEVKGAYRIYVPKGTIIRDFQVQ